MKNHSGGLALQAIFIPPVVSLPLFAFIILTGEGGNAHSVGIPVGLSAFMFYVASSAIYLLCMTRGIGMGMLGSQLVSQGIMTIMLGTTLGSPMVVPWAGLAALCVGLILLISLSSYEPPHTANTLEFLKEIVPALPEGMDITLPKADFARAVAYIPLPALYATADGSVASANEQMLSLIGSELIGSNIEAMFPPDINEIDLHGNTWLIFPGRTQEGTIVLLSPVITAEAPAIETSAPAIQDSMIDKKSGFYTEAYTRRRMTEELDRSKRYRRTISAALIKMDAESNTIGLIPQDDQERAFTLLVSMIDENIKNSDIAFRMKGYQVLVVMPETQLSSSKTFFDRVNSSFNQAVGKNKDIRYKPALKVGTLFYAGDDNLDFTQFMNELDTNLRRSSDD